jgi:protein-L-isoaspartate(D-aspartate) O-methyltransferase
MVERQLRRRGIEDERVLAAMGRVPRELFVPPELREAAYADAALPIGGDQTISQPYMVALISEQLALQGSERVLDVGTGSGYQAAVLAELGAEVYGVELLPALAESARTRLERLGYRNVHVRAGDGYEGWPEAAPFDAVVVACGAADVPGPLFEQLREGGKMVIRVGGRADQMLRVITKLPGGRRGDEDLLPVRFVPLRRADELGDAGDRPAVAPG